MTRYSDKAKAEVPDKNSDNARRRTAPAPHGKPASPKTIDSLYRQGKTVLPPEDHIYQAPQGVMDKQGKGYENDTSGWVRGEGPVKGGLYPQFDHSKGRGMAEAKGLKASGADCEKSPFSSANFKGRGER